MSNYIWEPLDGDVLFGTGPNGDESGFCLRRESGSKPVILTEGELREMLALIESASMDGAE